MNIVDAVIEAVAPQWAAKRTVARAAIRSFNATGRGRRQSQDGWSGVRASKPTENSQELAILREREREMARNNPLWRQGVRVLVGKTIGKGIRATVQSANARSLASVQTAWDAWAKSTLPDVTEQCDFYGMQELVMRAVVTQGECLVLRRVVDNELRLQLLTADYLDDSKDKELDDGGEIVGGIEISKYGAPVAYHLFKRHPSRAFGTTPSERIKASEVAHVFLIERIGQQRGESMMASVFTRLSDWDDYEDADLLRAKVAACFGAIITGIEPEGDPEVAEKMEPGMLQYMPSGTNVETLTPPANTGLRESALINHRAVAAGMGVTYESLTGDYVGATFSSARMGQMQMYDWINTLQQNVMIDRFCAKVWNWFMVVHSLQSDANPRVRAEWTVPSRTIIDPGAEGKSTLLDVRSGFKSWSGAVRERGLDPQAVANEIAADQQLFDTLKIVLDSDPRKVSVQGQGAINQIDETAKTDGPAKA